MTQLTVLTGPERRRGWSEGDRIRILAAAFAPGAVVTDVARQYDVSTALIYRWRQEARGVCPEPAFASVVVADDRPAPAGVAAITIDLADGARASIGASATPALVTATLRALRPWGSGRGAGLDRHGDDGHAQGDERPGAAGAGSIPTCRRDFRAPGAWKIGGSFREFFMP
jgi:transposase